MHWSEDLKPNKTGKQKILPMEGYEERFFSRTIGRFIRNWSVRRAKLAFVISTPIYAGIAAFAHFFDEPVTFVEAATFTTTASSLTTVIAFFSKHVPDIDFD